MNNRTAFLALIASATIWGTTVALSKLSIAWLGPYWLTTARFGLAASILGFASRKRLRAAVNRKVLLNGALGFGIVMIFQNTGIAKTSVSHASIIVGAVPMIVALVSAGMGYGRPRTVTWIGYAIALLGIILVAGGGGGGATALGDGLVLISTVLCGIFIALQPRVLREQDAAAVTAVQFAAGALVSLPLSLVASGLPHGPASLSPAIAFTVLVLVGTVIPFWLFAYGQAGVSAHVAGAFLNLEPLVGAIIGWIFFSNPVAALQILGVFAVIAGILVSAVRLDSSWLDRLSRAARQPIGAGERTVPESC